MAVEVIGTIKPKNGKDFHVIEAADVLMPSGKRLDEEEVGAGAASSAVSGHNTSTEAHNDIRLLIAGLSERLNAIANSDDTTLDDFKEVVAYIKANKDLIDSIAASKVSVSDIVNDLTSNVTDKPLSAAQGAALKKLIEEQGGGSDVTVDAALSETSENPVQNKAVKAAMDSFAESVGADLRRMQQEIDDAQCDVTVDAELSETSENPVQNKAVAKVVREANAAMTQLGGAVEALGQRVTPEVTAEDNGKVLTVVDGEWKAAEASSGGGSSGGSADLSELLETVTEPQEFLASTTFTNEYYDWIGGFASAILMDEATFDAWNANNDPVVVVYDGIEYDLEIQTMDGVKGVGNLAAFGGVGNGEPFAIVGMSEINGYGTTEYYLFCGSTVDTAPTQHTLAIYLQGEAVKLKAAYVPGAVIRSYVEEYIDEALGGDY